jgi:tRNA(Met) cytidine acetyltransferase
LDWSDLIGFAFARRPYESCLPACATLTLQALVDGLPGPHQTRLLIMRVIQHRSWGECAAAMQLPGRQAVETALRRITGELVLHYADASTRSQALRIQADSPQ